MQCRFFLVVPADTENCKKKIMDSPPTSAIIGMAIIAYIHIMVSSAILNGIIVFVYAKTKELHTPSNLLQVHLSIIGLIMPFCYSPFTLAGFLSTMLSCDCTVLYYHWLFGNILHFGVYPFSILLLSISYFLILKFNAVVLTYSRVAVGLSLVWICSIILNFPMFFITTSHEFIGCCEAVCRNSSAVCDTSFVQSFTPRLFTQTSTKYYNYRDLFAVILPTLAVFTTSAGSYIIYKKSLIRSSVSMELRMILLPVILSFAVGGYLIAHDTINWTDVTLRDETSPGTTLYVIFHMMWDSTGFVFALIVLFFNVKIRRVFLTLLSSFRPLKFIKCFKNLQDIDHHHPNSIASIQPDIGNQC